MSPSRTGRAAFVAIALLSAAGTVGVMLLLRNVTERKTEARHDVLRLAPIGETTSDPAEWGKSFPRQYDAYKRTVDVERTRYGGSENIQKLDSDALLRTIFDGYAFSIDYREERGHAYMLSDQRETERVTKKKQPGACLQCHASNLVAYRRLGLENGAPGKLEDPLLSSAGLAQLQLGFVQMCPKPYDEVTKTVEHPIACLDCHDPQTLAVRVTRPGFLAGIRALAKSSEPVPHLPSIQRWREGSKAHDYDPNADASRQELRSMVCGQCHVEYYFKGEGKLVTYPWHNGLKVEQIEKYYDDEGFSDWTHAQSGAKVLKAQHPEFELWSQGIHARSGVSCADCHMPYKREGALKFSDHHVRSPLLEPARSCQICHPYPEEEILGRARAIQDRTQKLLESAEKATVDLIGALKQAKEGGAPDAQLDKARKLQRQAQWRADFIAAENSMGFHAPQESARILAEAIDFARQGQIALLEAGQK